MKVPFLLVLLATLFTFSPGCSQDKDMESKDRISLVIDSRKDC